MIKGFLHFIKHTFIDRSKLKKIKDPINVFHGGKEKKHFNFLSSNNGADGYGHYLSNNESIARKYAKDSKQYITTAKLHIKPTNMVSLDKPLSHDSNSHVKDKFEKLIKKHDIKIDETKKRKYEATDIVDKIGKHFNEKDGNSPNHVNGHVKAAQELHAHGIHAGYGEYPIPGKNKKDSGKFATSYVVYGEARHQIEVQHSKNMENE